MIEIGEICLVCNQSEKRKGHFVNCKMLKNPVWFGFTCESFARTENNHILGQIKKFLKLLPPQTKFRNIEEWFKRGSVENNENGIT